MIQMLTSVIGQRGVDAMAFLLAFALTALTDSIFRDKLPHDHGRAFAVNGELSKGKARCIGSSSARKSLTQRDLWTWMITITAMMRTRNTKMRTMRTSRRKRRTRMNDALYEKPVGAPDAPPAAPG